MAGLAVPLALLIGISLGLLGGGGSILAVPLLVYVAGLPTQQAVATSLFVVGVTSLVGLVPHVRAGRVRWRTGLQFGISGMSGSYLGGRLGSQLPGTVLLTSFALMMLAASIAMIRGRQDTGSQDTGGGTGLRPVPMVALGVLVGSVTGLVGAGGGFLIVPALVIVGGLPMTTAVGTSLLVISLQSAAGLAGHLAGTDLPWGLALAVTTTAVAGSLLGARWCGRVDQATLRRSFGLMVLAMGAVVLAEQLSHRPPTHPAWWLLVASATATAAALLVRRRKAGPCPAHLVRKSDPGNRRVLDAFRPVLPRRPVPGLLPDWRHRHRSGRGRRPAPRHRGVPGRGRAARAADRRGDQHPVPR